jgi:hypothetical protein
LRKRLVLVRGGLDGAEVIAARPVERQLEAVDRDGASPIDADEIDGAAALGYTFSTSR